MCVPYSIYIYYIVTIRMFNLQELLSQTTSVATPTFRKNVSDVNVLGKKSLITRNHHFPRNYCACACVRVRARARVHTCVPACSWVTLSFWVTQLLGHTELLSHTELLGQIEILGHTTLLSHTDLLGHLNVLSHA